MSELVYLAQVDSTNLWCRQRIAQLSDGDAVYSSCQTKGRGRLGRSWENAPGSALYYSVVLKGDMADRACLPLAASLAVQQALRSCFGIETAIKWPNDLLLNGKKLVGILCEGLPDGIVCGIGVNLSQTAEFFRLAGLPYATSIAAETGRDPGPHAAEQLAQALSREFAPGGPLEVFRQWGLSPLLEKYQAACVNLGRTVTFDGGSGLARSVDSEGRLVVETAGGEQRVFTGEVHVGGIYGKL